MRPATVQLGVNPSTVGRRIALLERHAQWLQADRGRLLIMPFLCNSLTKRLDQIDLKKVADQVKKIVDTLDIAIASAERGDYDKASNEALMNLANGTFELAQQVEFFAATAYRIKALTFAIGETEDKIKKL